MTTELTPLTPGLLYEGEVGPWIVAGSQVVDIVVEDDRGGIETMALGVEVTSCTQPSP